VHLLMSTSRYAESFLKRSLAQISSQRKMFFGLRLDI
jgi:hypothetical protein